MSEVIKKEILPEELKSLSSEEAVLVMFSLVEGLSFNVLSPAVWEFSIDDALDIATKRYGIQEESVKQMLKRILVMARQRGQSNPMSSMF